VNITTTTSKQCSITIRATIAVRVGGQLHMNVINYNYMRICQLQLQL